MYERGGKKKDFYFLCIQSTVAQGASLTLFFSSTVVSASIAIPFERGGEKKKRSPSHGPTCYIFNKARRRIGPAGYKSCILQYTLACSAFGLMSAAENETSTNGSFMPLLRRQSFLFLHARPNNPSRIHF